MPNTSLLFLKGTPFFDLAGGVLALGEINTYAATTTTPATTYADAGGTTPNPNPLPLNAFGRLQTSVYLSDATAYPLGYKLTFEDSGGTVLTDLTVDNIPAAAATASGGNFAAEEIVWRQKTAGDSPITLTEADMGFGYELDTTAGNISITMPAAAGVENGPGVVFKKTAAANIVSIFAVSTIDSSTTAFMFALNREMKISSNGSRYLIDRVYDPYPGGIGEIKPFAFASAPSGWLECNGTDVGRLTYVKLFDAIGTAHGAGDGSTSFSLPDYRGRFLRGWDHGAGRDADSGSRTALDTGGNTGDTIGSLQADALESHHHFTLASDTVTTTPGAPTATTSGAFAATTHSISADFEYVIQRTATPADVGLSSDTGGSETRPANVNVLYCIKVE